MQHTFNHLLLISSFPTTLKNANIKPVFQTDDKTDKEKYGWYIFSLHWVKYMEELYKTKFFQTLINFFQNSNGVLLKFLSSFLFYYNDKKMENFRWSKWSGRCYSNWSFISFWLHWSYIINSEVLCMFW